MLLLTLLPGAMTSHVTREIIRRLRWFFLQDNRAFKLKKDVNLILYGLSFLPPKGNCDKLQRVCENETEARTSLMHGGIPGYVEVSVVCKKKNSKRAESVVV